MALFIRFLIYSLVLGLVAAACSDKYIVLSDQYVMNSKTGKVHPMKVDSTLQVYDEFKIKRSEQKDN